jgi:hypothetical protein
MAAGRTAEFRIPVDLLKAFSNEIRFIPAQLPHNGYITVDTAMLRNIILSDDVEARKAFAGNLAKLDKAGGRFVIVAE